MSPKFIKSLQIEIDNGPDGKPSAVLVAQVKAADFDKLMELAAAAGLELVKSEISYTFDLVFDPDPITAPPLCTSK